MSVLSSPRIYFRGQVSWDPIVTNNYQELYDENTGQTVYPGAVESVKAFRKEAIDRVTTGNWNPHGTHRSNFFDTSVSGFDLGAGVATEDPFVGSAVALSGMLVDLEPYGATSSQLFFDLLQFGVDGGYCIHAPRTSRFTARYINFSRNSANRMIAGVASVVWQASFAKADGLRIEAFDSPMLQRLSQALQAEDCLGLTVRFNAYRTIYYDNPNLRNGSPAAQAAAQALQKDLQGGGFQPNPARSLLVGTVGLWSKGEPAHEPGDRALTPTANSPLGSAQARIDGDRLTIDLSNSVPEVDADLGKKDLGELTVVAVDRATDAETPLGSLFYAQYDRAAYLATSGLVTLPLAPEMKAATAGSDLELRDAAGNALLSELPLRCIPATPNLYLDEGQQVPATFQVYERGVPARTVQRLSLYEMNADGTINPGTLLATDADGVLNLPLTAVAGKVTVFIPSFGARDLPAQGLDPLANTYMNVRVLPADSDAAQMAANWVNVYRRVLARWKAMAPCMDNWLDLEDPDQVRSFGPMIKKLTDPANFECFRFMPVTRDMTAGERALLYRFLDAEPPAPIGSQAPKKMNLTAASRAMRGN